MLKEQKNYDFKSELLQIHKPNLRDYAKKPNTSDFIFDNGVAISYNLNSLVAYTAIIDFVDYLFTSMSVSALIVKGNITSGVTVTLNKNIGSASGYMGYRITAKRGSLLIEGYDERGIAQAFYALEDIMNVKKAPYINRGVIERKALFSPRITQSPFGMYSYPEEAFKIMAHYGFDAIDVWIKDAYTDKRNNFIDLRLLGERAKKYGIDIFIELYAPHNVHPDDEGAQEFYDKLYGDIFDVYPDIRGITVVGEATQFTSRDPEVGKSPYSANFEDNIPTGKKAPGWWPCKDYPEWIQMIRNAVRKKSKTADVVFCTYNWGFAPEKERVDLIKNLPDDICINATWEMFHKYKVGKSVEDVWDYTLSFEGPGEYFLSEAKAAKEKNLKLYTISNTSGKTWNFGVVPYMPMPQQYIKRYKNMVSAHEQFSLSGLTENIHYAFYPSMINDLEKQAFFSGGKPLEKALDDILMRDYDSDFIAVKRATELFSKAITYAIPTNEDQYGAFRIGPAYPLWSGVMEGLPATIPEQGRMPAPKHAMFGNDIYFAVYTPDTDANNSLPGVRIFDEIKYAEKMEKLFGQGISVLEKLNTQNQNTLKLLNLAKFFRNTTRTVITVKRHYLLKQELSVAKTKENAEKLINGIEKLLLLERENVLDTIPIVKVDSSIGWEPSMEYACDEKALNWKLKQLDYELNIKLNLYRKANNLKI